MTPCPKPKTETDPGYLKWLTFQPCAVCGCFPCEPMHQRLLSGGTSLKPSDEHALPGCEVCHRETEHGINGGVLKLWNDRSGMKFKNKHDLRDYLKAACMQSYGTYLIEKIRAKFKIFHGISS